MRVFPLTDQGLTPWGSTEAPSGGVPTCPELLSVHCHAGNKISHSHSNLFPEWITA